MNSEFDYVLGYVDRINSLVADIAGYLVGREEVSRFSNVITSLRNSSKDFEKVISKEAVSESELIRDAARIALRISSQSKNIANLTFDAGFDGDLNSTAEELLVLAGKIKEIFSSKDMQHPIMLEQIGYSDMLKSGEHPNQLKQELEKIRRHSGSLKKTLVESELKLAVIAQKMHDLEEGFKGELNDLRSRHEAVMNDVEQKNNQFDDILGHVSSRVIAGDYEKSASLEKKMADSLRAGSLLCMMFIMLALVYTFLETTKAEFEWQTSLFRMTLTFLLSVPAAYLARESAKHREQQYQHQQTSLDLKAIPPFMASLPEEEQNKFKLEIAGRIFAARSKVAQQDAYPINTQEIIMALLNKFDRSAVDESKKNSES